LIESTKEVIVIFYVYISGHFTKYKYFWIRSIS
jgi:hypothetical protein